MSAMRFAALLVLVAASCQSSDFTFRPERVEPGRVVHYVKSNLDGSKPSLVSLYIADRDRIEVYKSEKDVDDSADVLAHLDWSRFSADRLDAGVITADGRREARAELAIRGSELVVKIGDTEQKLEVETFPLHVYNFDLMSLNVMLPHLTRPKGSFRIAFAEPTFGTKKEVMELRGFATARSGGIERVHGVATRRYSLAGAGMNGTFWVNEKDGLLEKFESPIPNNPGWNSLRLERRDTARMTPEEWRRYKLTHVGTGVDILPELP
jgi:hypothetical protein